jgi:hypothetical protein
MPLSGPRMERFLPPSPVRAEKLVTFRATVDAEKVLVMLCDARGHGQVLLPMQRVPETSNWVLSRPLSAGSYRYRYYAQRGDLLVYLSPADANDASCLIDGTEGILTVEPVEPAVSHNPPALGSEFAA